jgi:AcrR family transcriptional regulator
MKKARRGRPRSEQAHGAILTSAIELTREVGYDAVTMDAIAARAGVGKATVYRRWKTKEALVCEALQRLLEQIPPPDTGSTRGDLIALMKVQAGLYGDPATRLVLSSFVAAMARSERIAEVVRGSFYATRRNAMVVVIKRGIARRDLKKGLDLELALDVFNAPLFYRFLMTGMPIDEKVRRGVVDVFLRSFGTHVTHRRLA